MEVNRITIDGTQSGKAQLPAALFSAKVAVALLWEAVKAQQARWRQGTHSTKTRANVSGGGAKPFKQKGTGQARQGSNRAPNHVGGGTVFGPHPRDYGYEIPKSARKAALRSALSQRASEQAVYVLDSTGLDAPSTKAMVALLKTLPSASALVVGHEQLVLKRSTRNLGKSKYLEVVGINVYDVMNHDLLIVTESALAELTRRAQSMDCRDDAGAKVAA